SIALAARYRDLIGGLVIMAGTLKPDFAADHPLLAGVQGLQDPISPADPFYDWWHACEPSVPKAFLAELAKEASAMPAERWRAVLEEIHHTDLTEAARSVRARTLIVAGALDPLFGDAHQQALLSALPEPILFRAADCGHNPHWEDPVLVAKAIVEAF
ncbi:alpha/beta fold hydrolase, partial [Mesorhizobium sp.]|uniref:alpha/beta fold hydrolase n=1 Tax=Mesorhizobium sp. TaxID=1871066 RepID=UPI0035691F85